MYFALRISKDFSPLNITVQLSTLNNILLQIAPGLNPQLFKYLCTFVRFWGKNNAAGILCRRHLSFHSSNLSYITLPNPDSFAGPDKRFYAESCCDLQIFLWIFQSKILLNMPSAVMRPYRKV